jgi:glyoxylase-like metal-dependent hydrolase (beta-lactamase superfamily II)
LILVDPGIDGCDLNELADDLDQLGIPVVAGFSTHPHWDHLLWHPRFGEVPRYATHAGARAANEARGRAQTMAAESASGIPLELIGLAIPLPPGSEPVPGEIVEHQAHAIGHAAVLLADRGVLLAGDMLSDVLIPLLDSRRPDQVGAYESARPAGRGRQPGRCRGPRPRRRRRGPRGSGSSRRRSRLHRRAAARRGTGRRAAESKLALRPSPVEPGAGRALNRMSRVVPVGSASSPGVDPPAPRGLSRGRSRKINEGPRVRVPT